MVNLLCLALTFVRATSISTDGGDPDILTDFTVPPSLDPNMITCQSPAEKGQPYRYDGNCFAYPFVSDNAVRISFNLQGDLPVIIHALLITGRTTTLITKVGTKEFPALKGQSISTSVLVFPPGGINAPHNHPRRAELLLIRGHQKQARCTDSLGASDLFIFPTGMVHFQANMGETTALAIGMFGRANAGTVRSGDNSFWVRNKCGGGC